MDLDQLKQEYRDIENKLSSGELVSDPQRLQDLSRRYAELGTMIAQLEELSSLEQRIAENEEMANGSDEELASLAQAELEELRARYTKLKRGEEVGANIREAIIEIRPGVGGEESSLFAQDLMRMYTRFAERNGWKVTVLEESRSELKGIKEATLEISGPGAYPLLKNESGVHRVQRVPETEKSGRIHTSTASVAVLPKAQAIDIEIRPEDLQMDTFRSSGPGGQAVNKISSAVRITHIPSGMVVESQKGRSQAANRETAITILRSRLLQGKLDEEDRKRRAERNEQIGNADRSEKIRTYNFPQDRVTDHRVNTSWSNIEGIMDGRIDEMVSTLREALA